MSATPALQLQDLGYRIGGTEILRHLDLTIACGEKVALMGQAKQPCSTSSVVAKDQLRGLF
jgi:Fe-S cluster assembly ATPase SufC